MKRSDLVQQLHEINSQLQYKDAEQSVAVILDGISNALSNGGRAEIRGFGSFALNLRPPRTGRNPKSGEAV